MAADMPSVFSGQDINQKQQHQVDVNKEPQGSGVTKEQEVASRTDVAEKAPIVEVRESEKIPEAVEGWLEKIERGEDVKLSQPVTYQGQTIVKPAGYIPSDDKIVLPMSEEKIEEGLHTRVIDAARWLAEWCIRLIKKFPGRILYRKK